MPPVPKIARLPEEIRKWLHATLVQRSFGSIEEVTAELREMLRQAGVDMSIGKSAVGVESQLGKGSAFRITLRRGKK